MGFLIFGVLIIAIIVAIGAGMKQVEKRRRIVELGDALLLQDHAIETIGVIRSMPRKTEDGLMAVDVDIEKATKTVLIYMPGNARRRFMIGAELPLVYSAVTHEAVIHPMYVAWLVKQGKDYSTTDAVDSTDPVIHRYLHKETKDIEDGTTDGGFDSSDSGGSDGGGDGGGSD